MKTIVYGIAATAAALFVSVSSQAENSYGPGVTDTEIKLGQTMPFSGPASAFGSIGRIEAAYFEMINEQGGVNGRKINLIAYDDSYSPPKTVEQTRRLVESDEVLATFQGLGTAAQGAVQKYLNVRKVPQLLVASGASRFSDHANFPWTTPFTPSYQSEAHIWGKYILQNYPDAKVGVLFQNDDLGKDYLKGLRESLGSKASMIVIEEPYDTTMPTIDSQVVQIKASGADVFFNAATPKFAAQAIKKIAALGWKPIHLLNSTSSGIAAVIRPAGTEISQGIVTAFYLKDPSDPAWDADAGIVRYRAFMKKYAANFDPTDNISVFAYSAAQAMVEVLKQCGNDLTRENLMKQATSMSNVSVDLAFPGISLSTSPTDYRAIKQFQLLKLENDRWVRFGSPLNDDSKRD